MDEKGRITIPKVLRKNLRTKTLILSEEKFGLTLTPKLKLKQLAGLAPKLGIKNLTTENLRDKTEREF